MIRFFRRHKILCLLLFILAYLIMGATAPFLSYKKIEENTVNQFDPAAFRMEGAGPERVALLETNMSAWEERMRLLEQAEERIILSTFDMREGESTRDILSVLLAKAEEGVEIRILVDGVSGAVRGMCAHTVSIPMRESCESLNAGVSAGILMYALSEGARGK